MGCAPPKVIGKRVRKLRILHDLQQQELATRSNLHKNSIERIEAGRFKGGSLIALSKIAQALRVDISVLVSEDAPEYLRLDAVAVSHQS